MMMIYDENKYEMRWNDEKKKKEKKREEEEDDELIMRISDFA